MLLDYFQSRPPISLHRKVQNFKLVIINTNHCNVFQGHSRYLREQNDTDRKPVYNTSFCISFGLFIINSYNKYRSSVYIVIFPEERAVLATTPRRTEAIGIGRQSQNTRGWSLPYHILRDCLTQHLCQCKLLLGAKYII